MTGQLIAPIGSSPIDMVTATFAAELEGVARMRLAALRHDPVYLLSRDERESRRLAAQAEVYEPATRRILERARIRPGMRILDVGSGAGDVALLAARLSGPHGAVVGVDANGEILVTAGRRVREAGLDNVEFIAADMRDLPPLAPFDAIIGRLVLMYVADPVVAMRALLPHLKRGGVVAFAEFNLTGDAVAFWPRLPLWDHVWRWIQGIPAGTGLEFAMGWKLQRTFAAAGVPGACLSLESPLLPAIDGTAAFILAETTRSMLPLLVKCGREMRDRDRGGDHDRDAGGAAAGRSHDRRRRHQDAGAGGRLGEQWVGERVTHRGAPA